MKILNNLIDVTCNLVIVGLLNFIGILLLCGVPFLLFALAIKLLYTL
jgi:hypothetical protein